MAKKKKKPPGLRELTYSLAAWAVARLRVADPGHRVTADMPLTFLITQAVRPVPAIEIVFPKVWEANRLVRVNDSGTRQRLRFAAFHEGRCLGLFDARGVIQQCQPDVNMPGRYSAVFVVGRTVRLSVQFHRLQGRNLTIENERRQPHGDQDPGRRRAARPEYDG